MKRLLSYDHVLVSPTSGRFSGPADEVLAEQGVKRRVALSVPSFLVLLESLETDDLIAFVPRQLLAGHRGELRVIRPPFELPGFDVIAAWHTRVDSYPPHRWLREGIETQARKLPRKA